MEQFGRYLVKRISIFVFGAVSYALFFVVFCYAMGFVRGVLVPKGINSGTPAPLAEALLVNSLLLGAFAVQHTIMARPAFKAWLTRSVPKSVERSIFVFLASAILAVTFWQWRPLPAVVWRVETPAVAMLLTAVSWMGFGVVLLSSFLISHFDLFGLRQVWLQLREKAYTSAPFKLTGLYKFVRHPLMLGFLLAFWSTPLMTSGHLLFAGLTTVYILMGIQFEERDLERQHGAAYRQYKAAVPMLIPYKGAGPAETIEATARRAPAGQGAGA